jgi:cytochrome c-type biogenesis protein
VDRRLAALLAAAALLVGLVAYAVVPRSDEAPTFRVVTTEGEILDLADARGKTIVLDLMAVNCAACRTLTKDILKPLWDEHGGRDDFVLWSIDVWAGLPGQVGETAEDLRRLKAEEGLPWPHALDDGTVWRDYAAAALPQLVVVDPEGRVVLRASAPELPSLARVRAAVAGETEFAGIPRIGLVGLAAVAGAAAVFAPCSIALLPAYFGMVLQQRRRPGALVGAVQASVGVVAVYALIALLFLPFGDALRPLVPRMGITVGLLLVAFGAASLAGFDWSRLTRRFVRNHDGSYWGFGFWYGVASFGCTGPLFLPILFGGFVDGPLVGAGVFAAYLAGIAVLLVLIAALASWGREGPLRRLGEHGVLVNRAVAVLWILAGLSLAWYDYRAFQ